MSDALSEQAFDPLWDKKYAEGFMQNAPWDAVVKALFRKTPLDRPRAEVTILEVACGTCSNIRFAAKMGFRVTGLDASYRAVTIAHDLFAREGLQGSVLQGSFTELPYKDSSFDMVIDRCGISHTGFAMARLALAEIHRVLKPQGIFFWIPFSDRHSSAASGESGDSGENRRIYGGLRKNISEGDIVGNGQACFYSPADIQRLFAYKGWALEEMIHNEYYNILEAYRSIYAEWHVTARKISNTL